MMNCMKMIFSPMTAQGDDGKQRGRWLGRVLHGAALAVPGPGISKGGEVPS